MVRQKLLEAIFKGELLPGQPVKELVLSKSFAVSQSTVREALVELEHDGLMDRTPHRGTHVKNLTSVELFERIDVRVALETLACMRALRNGFGPDDFGMLDKLARDIVRQEPTADWLFHRHIWKRAGNATLLHELEQLSLSLFAFVGTMRVAALQNPQERLASHFEYIEALRKKRETTIREAIQRHLDSAYRGFRDSRFPDFKSLAESLRKPNFPGIQADVLATLTK